MDSSFYTTKQINLDESNMTKHYRIIEKDNFADDVLLTMIYQNQ